MKRYRLVIKEDIASENFLMELSKQITSDVGDFIVKQSKTNKDFVNYENKNGDDFYNYSIDIPFSKYLKFDKEYQKFIEFLSVMDSNVAFVNVQNKQNNALYDIRKRNISVFIDDILYQYENNYDEFVEKIQKYMVDKYSNILHHELSHAYDSYISNNYINNSHKQNLKKKEYINSTTEVNAFYNQAKNILHNVDGFDINSMSLEDYYTYFVMCLEELGVWSELDIKQKKRIQNRIYGEWYESNK